MLRTVPDTMTAEMTRYSQADHCESDDANRRETS
jgi:hypothetical protein